MVNCTLDEHSDRDKSINERNFDLAEFFSCFFFIKFFYI